MGIGCQDGGSAQNAKRQAKEYPDAPHHFPIHVIGVLLVPYENVLSAG